MAATTDYATLYRELEARWPAIATTVLVLLAVLVLPRLLRPDPLAGIPVVGDGHKAFMKKGGWAIYTEGYNKVSVHDVAG